MGYFISNLYELPKVFDWHLFLIGDDDYNASAIADFFRFEFLSIAKALGEHAAIISGDNLSADLNKLLPYHYEFADSLWTLHTEHAGLLMIDKDAMSFLIAKSDSEHYYRFGINRNHPVAGSIYFIPFQSIEYAYHSERELYTDILMFARGYNDRLIKKTELFSKRIANGTLVQEFNQHWYHPQHRGNRIVFDDRDHDYHLYNTMMIALSSIKNNPIYHNCLEDQINDVLKADLSITPHWRVHDQTRQGYSESNARPGELDLLLKDLHNLDIAIIEALAVNCIDKTKISGHFKKMLVNYDPLGVPIYSLVLYSRCANFSSFWNKLLPYFNDELIPEITAVQSVGHLHIRYYVQNSIVEDGMQYASLRHAKGILSRNGRPAYLHIYALDLA